MSIEKRDRYWGGVENVRSILDVQKRLLPDLVDILAKRYNILHHIMVSRVIGRRALAANLGMTERVLRAEVDFLKEQGLIDSDSSGMRVTEAGRKLLGDMEAMVKEWFGLSELEERLRQAFSLKQVIVVPGDSDISPFSKIELGRAGAAVLRRAAGKAQVIAVTGGSTMAEVAEHLTSAALPKGMMFVPARGGLGEDVEYQANTIASAMAKKTGGNYRMLHVPDHLPEEAYQSLIQDPSILEVVQEIRGAGIVIHGIGEAIPMAKRRKVDGETIHSLLRDGALAEAWGYYFDQSGAVVHKTPTLGLRLEDIQETETVIAVAGGKSKGKAIAAVLQFGQEDVLVTDEASAQEMLKGQEVGLS